MEEKFLCIRCGEMFYESKMTADEECFDCSIKEMESKFDEMTKELKEMSNNIPSYQNLWDERAELKRKILLTIKEKYEQTNKV